MLYTILAALGLAASALAAPHAAAHGVLHEKRNFPARNRGARVDPDSVIPVRIALKQSNLDRGEELLMGVSHPLSENYGKHFSAAEVHDFFAPAADTLATVKDWLLQAGIEAEQIMEYTNKGWLSIDMPVWQAEQLLSTEYHEHHTKDGIRVGCDEYSLPSHVSQHVDYIRPGVMMSPPLKKSIEKRSQFPPYWPYPNNPFHHGPPRSHPNWYPHWPMPPGAQGLPPDLQNCAVNITPTCIKALYHIPEATSSDPANVMGLYESGDAFAQQDISLDFQHFAKNVPANTSPKVLSVDGGVAPVAPGDPRNTGESDIDLFLAYSLIYPQTVTVYQVDDIPNSSGETNITGFLNTFLDSIDGSYCSYSAYGITGDSPGIDAQYPDTQYPNGHKGALECGKYPLTRVVSISYGEAEAELPRNYVERQCNEFMKLGMQGHSIFVAAGDYGVASFPGSSGNENGCLSAPGLPARVYNPDYPCGCPYITAVGATQLYPNQTVYSRESSMEVNLTALAEAAGDPPLPEPYEYFNSGGGFSNFFTPPSYQQEDVANYLAHYRPDVPSYVANSTGTNYGQNGGLYNRAGRGYPDVAANGAFLLAYNNLTLNSWFGTSLASPIFGSVITLINEERTKIGKGPVGFVNPTLYKFPYVLNDITNGSNTNCNSSGFRTAPGWDPVTGLGTPNYPKMLELFLSLP